jgi:hypothetical protein
MRVQICKKEKQASLSYEVIADRTREQQKKKREKAERERERTTGKRNTDNERIFSDHIVRSIPSSSSCDRPTNQCTILCGLRRTTATVIAAARQGIDADEREKNEQECRTRRALARKSNFLFSSCSCSSPSSSSSSVWSSSSSSFLAYFFFSFRLGMLVEL